MTQEAEALADRLAPRHRECLWHVFQLRTSKEIAGELGIGVGTVRSHLRQVLTKTGTHRQNELAALIMRSVAMLGETAHPEHG